ncbi:glycerol-3-phosphate dehydrogenase [NAD(+)] 1, chloroplastic-like, partial [Carica papaya]|uniref:glycerol-3-phosphate dehydrogenase [NAD(+)] 1, chloroplastic-like n=1 Tax=Carica papaya TaxID=3649 RepID=UPI000B8CCEB4
MRFLSSFYSLFHLSSLSRRTSSQSLSLPRSLPSFLSASFMAPAVEHNQNDDKRSTVTVVGSGNWGSVAAKLIASNTLNLPSFNDEVRMWVFEETLPSGEKLTDVINRTN